MTGAYETYDDVRARLDEIVDAVNAEGVTLDEALALYEEAVKLGLLACDLSEEDAQALVDGDDIAAGKAPGTETVAADEEARLSGGGVAAGGAAETAAGA